MEEKTVLGISTNKECFTGPEPLHVGWKCHSSLWISWFRLCWLINRKKRGKTWLKKNYHLRMGFDQTVPAEKSICVRISWMWASVSFHSRFVQIPSQKCHLLPVFLLTAAQSGKLCCNTNGAMKEWPSEAVSMETRRLKVSVTLMAVFCYSLLISWSPEAPVSVLSSRGAAHSPAFSSPGLAGHMTPS